MVNPNSSSFTSDALPVEGLCEVLNAYFVFVFREDEDDKRNGFKEED